VLFRVRISNSPSATDLYNKICNTDGTTDEKLEGTPRGVDADPIMVAILLLFFPVALFCSAHVSPIPCPTFFPFNFKVGGVA